MHHALLDPTVSRIEVVHPLFDTPETKCDAGALGPMHMTLAVRAALFALRGYLVLMGLMLGYHLLDLAGVFGAHVK